MHIRMTYPPFFTTGGDSKVGKHIHVCPLCSLGFDICESILTPQSIVVDNAHVVYYTSGVHDKSLICMHMYKYHIMCMYMHNLAFTSMTQCSIVTISVPLIGVRYLPLPLLTTSLPQCGLQLMQSAMLLHHSVQERSTR